jgi:hypothetical protein
LSKADLARDLEVGAGYLLRTFTLRNCLRLAADNLKAEFLEVEEDSNHILFDAVSVENSCSTPSILTEVIAAPGREERMMRRNDCCQGCDHSLGRGRLFHILPLSRLVYNARL